MNKIFKKLFSGVLVSAIIFSSVSAYAYSVYPYKQTYYYSNVVPYVNNTSGFSSALQTAFTTALNDWNSSSVNNFEWGAVSSIPDGCSDNSVGVYYLANATTYGKCDMLFVSDGTYAQAWAALNQYALETNTTTSANFKRSTAVHELGHAMSLADLTSGTAIMNKNRTRTSIYTPQTDDISGVNSVY